MAAPSPPNLQLSSFEVSFPAGELDYQERPFRWWIPPATLLMVGGILESELDLVLTSPLALSLCALAGILSLAFGLFLPWWRLSKGRKLTALRRYHFTERELVTESPQGKERLEWNYLPAFSETEDSFLLHHSYWHDSLVPKSSLDNSQIKTIRYFLQVKVADEKRRRFYRERWVARGAAVLLSLAAAFFYWFELIYLSS